MSLACSQPEWRSGVPVDSATGLVRVLAKDSWLSIHFREQVKFLHERELRRSRKSQRAKSIMWCQQVWCQYVGCQSSEPAFLRNPSALAPRQPSRHHAGTSWWTFAHTGNGRRSKKGSSSETYRQVFISLQAGEGKFTLDAPNNFEADELHPLAYIAFFVAFLKVPDNFIARTH